ncbi:hypothetical protein GQ43DRAFT_484175 [Delitschia confertaspora ATCC 74209]|uniref:Uncharacterized protein n=1 Tax=Delitschia confertaspora ATCC 74209 TaxID=1513339 RepID=A0A9P4JDE7_9PLEO|nr:hypothetical protein GQ43DRAFT_484175 [Delitschia confertaspora ATCC 74209]
MTTSNNDPLVQSIISTRQKHPKIDEIIVAAGDTIIATYTKECNTLPAEFDVCYEKKKSAAAAETAAIETAAANRINTSASDSAAASGSTGAPQVAPGLSPALIEQLVQALLNQQLASTTLAPALILVITPSALKNKPLVYDGAPSSYEIFKYKAMEIICKETNLFFNNRSITGFIFSCCTGRAETMIWPWYNNKLDCTPEEM